MASLNGGLASSNGGLASSNGGLWPYEEPGLARMVYGWMVGKTFTLLILLHINH